MTDTAAGPESTAVRVALWRAMHVQVDPPPHVLDDQVGLQLIGPDPDWRQRPDMDPLATARVRASIVSRARLVEDLVAEKADRGVGQYVLLGAGLDTFTQRRPEVASRITVFEVDQPGPQAWKQHRLAELGLGTPRFVPVDFETDSWWDRLLANGFDPKQPAVPGVTGCLYVSHQGRDVGHVASNRHAVTRSHIGDDVHASGGTRGPRGAAGAPLATDAAAQASGTPFISYYTPEQIVALARDAGLSTVQTVTAEDYTQRYFADRADGLLLFTTEELLVATT